MEFIIVVVLLAGLIVTLDILYDRLPIFLQKCMRGWRAFSHLLGKFMSFIVLTVVWVFLVSAYGIIFRLRQLGSRRSQKDTNWQDVPELSDIRYQS